MFVTWDGGMETEVFATRPLGGGRTAGARFCLRSGRRGEERKYLQHERPCGQREADLLGAASARTTAVDGPGPA